MAVRSGWAVRLGAGAVILGTLTTTAPISNAEDVEQNCQNLGGRYYHIVQDDGSYYEQCCYPSLNPDVHEEECDAYVDGDYVDTDRSLPPKAPRTPIHRPPDVAPPPLRVREAPPNPG